MSHLCIPSNKGFHQSWTCYTASEFSNVWLYLVGTVMLFDPRLQANVQVELVFLVVACPCYFLKAIGLGVDELGVLGDWLVWVPDKKSKEGNSFKWKNSQRGEICAWLYGITVHEEDMSPPMRDAVLSWPVRNACIYSRGQEELKLK